MIEEGHRCSESKHDSPGVRWNCLLLQMKGSDFYLVSVITVKSVFWLVSQRGVQGTDVNSLALDELLFNYKEVWSASFSRRQQKAPYDANL